MIQEKFEEYLKEIRRFAVRFKENPHEHKNLLQLIEDTFHHAKDHPHYHEFLHGERAFYDSKYDQALKHYLKASSVPLFQFFCYRASAYLFHMMGNHEKALSFAKKAHHLYPEDHSILLLLEKIHLNDPTSNEILEIQNKIKALEKEALKHHLDSINKTQFLESANIFNSAAPQEELFGEDYAVLAVATSLAAEQKNQINSALRMESNMNTESDIFSSSKNRENKAAQALTERLYPEKHGHTPYIGHGDKPHNPALEELQRLAMSSRPHESLHNPENVLEHRIKSFQVKLRDQVHHYLEQGKGRLDTPDYTLYYLHGWPNQTKVYQNFALTEHSRKTAGGMFLRWNGKGIVLNPGPGFMHNFHHQGLNIRDIDYVIVTGDQRETYSDVKEIYELNYELNKICHELQIIHYYFNFKAFQDLSRELKPHFKQERNTIHSLELFMDSPDVERVDLADGISLHYFHAAALPPHSPSSETVDDRLGGHSTTLGIRLELKTPAASPQEKTFMRIGYVSNAAWTPLLSHHLGNCDLLITGFGNTSSGDFNKISYNGDSLGFYGTYSLLEEVGPRLLLTGEYSGREGDIRVEAAQKIRMEYASGRTSRTVPAVLPADSGLKICLKTLHVKCSITEEWIEPTKIRAIKTANTYGHISYLAPSCCY